MQVIAKADCLQLIRMKYTIFVMDSRIIRTSLVILVSVFTLSCSNAKGGLSADDVIAKINNGEKLESADYETMLDYLVDFCDTGEMTANDYESGRSVGEEYPYFMTFCSCIG